MTTLAAAPGESRRGAQYLGDCEDDARMSQTTRRPAIACEPYAGRNVRTDFAVLQVRAIALQ
jgi:hypothetical protein